MYCTVLYMIKNTTWEIKRAPKGDFRYLVTKSLYSSVAFLPSKSPTVHRNPGESYIVFPQFCVCVETGHRMIKSLTWDCTWTQRKGFGWIKGWDIRGYSKVGTFSEEEFRFTYSLNSLLYTFVHLSRTNRWFLWRYVLESKDFKFWFVFLI